MSTKAREFPAITLHDSSDSHCFAARKLFFGGASGTDYSFNADGSTVTLLGSGGAGTATLGDGILAGSLDGSIPLRPCAGLSWTGGAGIPWKNAIIYTEASTTNPATPATSLLAGTLGSTTSKITDMGDGRASIQPGSIHWRYKSLSFAQVLNGSGRRDSGTTWDPFPSPVVYADGAGGSGTDILTHLAAKGTVESFNVDPASQQQCSTATATYTRFQSIPSGPYTVGRVASYSFFRPQFGTYWNLGQARAEGSFGLVEIEMAAGDTLASRYSLSSLSVRLGMKCADPGNTGSCTSPGGLPADFPVSKSGQCFDTLLEHFDSTNDLINCGNMTPVAPRTITIGWGWVPSGSSSFAQIRAHNATALAAVAPTRSVGWYQDTDISSIVSQAAPAGTIKLYVAVFVTSDGSHPIDYPSGVPAFTMPAQPGGTDAYAWYTISDDSSCMGFWEFSAS